MRQKWYICSLAPSPNLHMRTGISLANFHFFTATLNTFCLKSPLLVVNVFLNLKQSIHPPPIQFSSFLTLIYICESFFGRKERTRKKFDLEKAALPMNFSSPGCTMVTLWSDKLLYMRTLYCPTGEGVSKAKSPKQANEWAVRANERTDEWVAQYLRLDFWLIWTIVHGWKKKGSDSIS